MRIDGFHEIAEGTLFHRPDRGLYAWTAGDQDDGNIKVVCSDPLEELDAVQTRHVDVAENQIEGVRLESVNGSRSIVCGRGLVSSVRENARVCAKHRLVVVHDEDSRLAGALIGLHSHVCLLMWPRRLQPLACRIPSSIAIRARWLPGVGSKGGQSPPPRSLRAACGSASRG